LLRNGAEWDLAVPLHRLQRSIQAQRSRGRAFQPRYTSWHVIASWLGGLLAIAALGLLSSWSGYGLVVAPFGASSVLLFGAPQSPLAQPRNMVLGNAVAALVAVICVTVLGKTPLAMGLAVGLAIAAGQRLRCLHPPAGAVALLGVLLNAHPPFVLVPVLSGSLLLVLIAVLFHRLVPATGTYPHHWL
jgi:CBS-domain-containing membrane protein